MFTEISVSLYVRTDLPEFQEVCTLIRGVKKVVLGCQIILFRREGGKKIFCYGPIPNKKNSPKRWPKIIFLKQL